MDIETGDELVAKIQEHYLSQFRDFVERQRKRCKGGSSEVKFSLTGETNAFRRMVVVDFVRNDDGVEGIQFEPESVLSFEQIDRHLGDARLTIAGLRWDAAVILHDVQDVESAIGDWFTSWFDPDESSRFSRAGDVSQCIHAVYIEPNELQVDFGTASPAAFEELLNSLTAAGATQIHVSA
jgi:hypothetical protein